MHLQHPSAYVKLVLAIYDIYYINYILYIIYSLPPCMQNMHLLCFLSFRQKLSAREGRGIGGLYPLFYSEKSVENQHSLLNNVIIFYLDPASLKPYLDNEDQYIFEISHGLFPFRFWRKFESNSRPKCDFRFDNIITLVIIIKMSNTKYCQGWKTKVLQLKYKVTTSPTMKSFSIIIPTISVSICILIFFWFECLKRC